MPYALPDDDVVATAQLLATVAHLGQVDKAGRPYIGHPADVASRLSDRYAIAAGWLHDTVEDTWVTLALLVDIGFPAPVVTAVDAVTKRKHAGESHEQAIARAAADPIGAQVKRADIASNTDPARMARLDQADRARLTAKYARALALLEELTGGRRPA